MKDANQVTQSIQMTYPMVDNPVFAVTAFADLIYAHVFGIVTPWVKYKYPARKSKVWLVIKRYSDHGRAYWRYSSLRHDCVRCTDLRRKDPS